MGGRIDSEYAVKAIRVANENIESVIVETLLHPDVVLSLDSLADILTNNGVKEWRLMPYIPAHNEHIDKINMPDLLNKVESVKERAPSLNIRIPCSPKHCLSEEPKKIIGHTIPMLDNHCGAGVGWMAIAYDGNYKFCSHSTTSFGLADEKYIADAWQNISAVVSENISPKNACVTCEHYQFCKSGCHLSAIDEKHLFENTKK